MTLPNNSIFRLRATRFATLALGVSVLVHCSVPERDFGALGDGTGTGDGDGDGDGDMGGSGATTGDGDGDGDGDTGGTDNGNCGPYQEEVGSGANATCECIEGHTGNDCTECDDGYQDNDDDGSCMPSCGDDSCSGAGTCDDASGAAVCDCDGLRAGDSCERCSAGYELLNSGMCTWIGGIVQNGSFDDDSAWTLNREAIIHATKVGRLPDSAQCDGGSFSQIVEMPPADGGGKPLLLTFKAWRTGSNGGSLGARLGDVFYQTTLAGTVPASPNNTFCLGPGSLGGDKLLEFTIGGFLSSCVADDINIDEVDIVEDTGDICPTTNGITNGSFTVNSDWTLSNGSISGGNLYLSKANQCASGSLTATQGVVFPSQQESAGAAIRVTYNTGNGNGSSSCTDPNFCADHLYIGMKTAVGGYALRLADLQSTGVTTTDTICIPPHLRGVAGELEVSAGRSGCSSVYGFNSRVEEIAIVDEPGCRPIKGIMDGDFESDAPPDTAWTYYESGSTFFKEDGADPSEGTKNAVFGISDRCKYPNIQTPFVTPATMGDERAAVIFDYKFPVPAVTDVNMEACTATGCLDLTNAADWTQQVICTDPLGIGPGVPNYLRFNATAPNGSGTSCSDTFAYQNMRIDNIRVVKTHPDCE